jgi:hypothetical protein
MRALRNGVLAACVASSAGCGGAAGPGPTIPLPHAVTELMGSKHGPIVTSTADRGPGSLRQAVLSARSGDTITFVLEKHAIIALDDPIELKQALTIAGPGASLVTISGARRSRIFAVRRGVKAAITGLTLRDGKAESGGAIDNEGDLTLDRDVFSNDSAAAAGTGPRPFAAVPFFDPRPRGRNARARKHPDAPVVPLDEPAAGRGGAIDNAAHARLVVSNSRFEHDEAVPYGYGAAVYDEGRLTVNACTFSANVAGGPTSRGYGIGGAIAQYGGSLAVSNGRFDSNVAGDGRGGSWGTGGAIYSTSGSLRLDANTFERNRAGGDFGYGGAIYADHRFRGTGNTFVANAAFGRRPGGYAYGGAIYAGGGVSLSGDTFSHNSARGGSASVYGYSFGGALDSERSASLTSVTFDGNSASGGAGGSAEGGAAYLGGGTSTWTSVTFSKNRANASGAGAYAAGGAAAVFAPLAVTGSSSFSSNNVTVAPGSIGGVGGAIALEAGPLSFSGTVSTNTATTQGGGFWLDDAAAISNSLVSENRVSETQNPNDGGAGIYVSIGGMLTLRGSTLAANSTAGSASSTGGGGMFNAGGGTIVNSTIEGNTSSVDGGGIENDTTGTFSLTNVTVYENAATNDGGNLKNLYSSSTMSLASSIVAAGAAAAGNDISNDGTIVSGDYNIVETAPSGPPLSGTTTHDLAEDPVLAVLANNGGPTPTDADGSGSPGTAYIPFTVCQANGVLVDQRGYARNPKGLGFCDVGAFEDQNPP